MKWILITFFIAFTAIAYSADITVTANDALPPSNTGNLSIEIDAALNNAPFDITVSKTDGGYTYQNQISSYSLFLDNLGPGEYCINIVSDDGCVADVCIVIKTCLEVNPKQVYYCFPHMTAPMQEHLPDPIDPFVLIVGESTSKGVSEGLQSDSLDEGDFNYKWYDNIDTSIVESALMYDLVDSTSKLVNQIIQTGSTPYDTTYQLIIDNVDASFAIGYGPNKSIEWVWHNLTDTAGELRSSPKIESSTLDSEITIYPNPVSSRFTVRFTSGKYISLTIYDIQGQKIKASNLEKNDSFKTYEANNYNPGLYFISLKSNEGEVYCKKFTVF